MALTLRLSSQKALLRITNHCGVMTRGQKK